MSLSAPDKIRQLIIARCWADAGVTNQVPQTAEEIKTVWDPKWIPPPNFPEKWHHSWLREVEREIRYEAELVEHGCYAENKAYYYECDTRVLTALDGSLIAFPYYHSEAKHSEPDSFPWVDDAFFVDYGEELITVKVWRKL